MKIFVDLFQRKFVCSIIMYEIIYTLKKVITWQVFCDVSSECLVRSLYIRLPCAISELGELQEVCCLMETTQHVTVTFCTAKIDISGKWINLEVKLLLQCPLILAI